MPNNNGSEKKWTVDELREEWGGCHRRTIYRTLTRHKAKVIHIAGRLLIPDAEKQRIEAAHTTIHECTGRYYP
jgi:hypothetical protein